MIQLHLEIISENGKGRSATFPAGTSVLLGLGNSVDFELPASAGIAATHCQIDVSRVGARLRDLDSPVGTILNEREVIETPLSEGDKLRIGPSIILVRYLDEDFVYQEPSAPPLSAIDFLTMYDLMETLDADLVNGARELSAIELLNHSLEKSDFAAAVEILARLLTPDDAVSWSVGTIKQCSGETLSDAELVALTAASDWVDEPTESSRRKAEAAAEG